MVLSVSSVVRRAKLSPWRKRRNKQSRAGRRFERLVSFDCETAELRPQFFCPLLRHIEDHDVRGDPADMADGWIVLDGCRQGAHGDIVALDDPLRGLRLPMVRGHIRRLRARGPPRQPHLGVGAASLFQRARSARPSVHRARRLPEQFLQHWGHLPQDRQSLIRGYRPGLRYARHTRLGHA
jgi:hypothetical protein